MSAPILVLSSARDDAAVKIIGQGLNDYNAAIVGYSDGLPLNVLVKDPATGAVLGGITGRTSLGLLFIDLVYLPQNLRGHDLGTRMLAMAEAEAQARGCKAGVLYTISFQAPDFYRRLGWEVFGEVACDPPGTARVFLRKTFAAPADTSVSI